MRRFNLEVLAWLALGAATAVFVSCSGDGESASNAGTGGSAASGSGGSSTGGSSASGGGTFDAGPSGGSSGDGGFDPDAGCATYTAGADNKVLPSDIIIAVDQSGSMGDEVVWVQNQLNDFSQQIMGANIDVHVILIVEKPGGSVGEHPICVPPPLAGDNCADNPPVFTHVNQHVDSHDALVQIVSTYDDYQHVLRPEAKKHIIAISDDESEDMSASAFHAQITALAMLEEYTFHAIVCTSDCSYAADIGSEYMELVANTGGVLGDLCQQDFAPVWDEVSTQVIDGTQLACEWEIPAPPEGEELAPDKVNVMYSSDAGEKELGRVDSEADCEQYEDAWYYDDPSDPTTIYACPDLCEEIKQDQNPQVNIVFGCTSTSPVPK